MVGSQLGQPQPAPSPSRSIGLSTSLVTFAAAVAALRLYHCTLLPVSTGDLPRHLFYGLFVLRDGLTVAGASLADLHGSLASLSWAELPYSYPPLTLLFFATISGVSPTLFIAKLVLTLIEGANAWMIARHTGQRWLGAVYWASPASIWWVSREGQFEPLQSLFVIGAILTLKKHRKLAFVLLALAVQVKLLAILMLPWFLYRIRRQGPRVRAGSLAVFGLGFLPTIFALTQYPAISNLAVTIESLRYNPYFWNFLDRAIFLWNPTWLVIVNQVASYGVLVMLLLRARSSLEPISFFAPTSFLVLVKGSMLGQFWYLLQLPAFVLPIPERRWRFWLIALTPLLDVYGSLQALLGPFGWTMGDYYAGFDVFRPLLLP